MEFIEYDEASSALKGVGVRANLRDESHLLFEADSASSAVGDVAYIHLAAPECAATPHEQARVVTAATMGQLPALVDEMVDALHLSQVLMYPVGKWRSVFDAVAFSLASNEDWQAVDAMATVRLHTRDPLLCEPGDYQTVRALLGALFSDAQSPDQGVTIVSTAKPFIAEIVPEGCVRIMVGSQVLADEIVESLQMSA